MGYSKTTRVQTLKNAVITTLILRHFDPDSQISSKNSSDYISTFILSQHNDQGIPHTVAFFFVKHVSEK